DAFAAQGPESGAALSSVGISVDPAYFPGGGHRTHGELMDGASRAIILRSASDSGRHSVLLPLARKKRMIRRSPTQHCRNRVQNERPAVCHFTHLLANRVLPVAYSRHRLPEKPVGVKGILGS